MRPNSFVGALLLSRTRHAMLLLTDSKTSVRSGMHLQADSHVSCKLNGASKQLLSGRNPDCCSMRCLPCRCDSHLMTGMGVVS